jgi:hypothetical protein
MPGLQNCAMDDITNYNNRIFIEKEPIKLRIAGARKFIRHTYDTYHDDNVLKRAILEEFLGALTGERGMVAKGKYGGYIDQYFGKGPAQDLLKQILKHFKTEVSARQLGAAKDLYVPEDV